MDSVKSSHTCAKLGAQMAIISLKMETNQRAGNGPLLTLGEFHSPLSVRERGAENGMLTSEFILG